MLRITGGTWRGRRVSTPKGKGTRPTAEKVREAVFASLASLVDLEGAVVFDLFAGSGALGIEALSRGASHCTFVEAHPPTAAIVRANLRTLNVPRESWRVASMRALAWLRMSRAALPTPPPARAILLDPPYGSGGAAEVLEELARSPLLAEDSVIVMEAAGRDPAVLPPGLELIRTKRYGDTEIRFVKRRAGSPLC